MKRDISMVKKRVYTLCICFIITLGSSGCSGVRPTTLGVKDGRLSPCPSSSNCVSSQSLDREHAISPLTYAPLSVSAAHDKLKKIIQGMKRTEIVTDTGTYIHAEFTSAVWRFVDDVEFFFDESSNTIHIRSASRLGKSDFGVNRKRIESIRSLWNAREN